MNSNNKLRQILSSPRLVPLMTLMGLSLISAGCSAGAGSADQAETLLKVIAGYTALLFLILYGGVVLWKVIERDEIGTVIEENGGGASMSRFQFLIFTFVVAFGIVLLLAKNNKFPDVPADVLTLIGISASTYAVSKGITASTPDMPTKNTPAGQVIGADADQANPPRQ